MRRSLWPVRLVAFVLFMVVVPWTIALAVLRLGLALLGVWDG